MRALRHNLVAVLFAALLQSVAVAGDFQLEVEVLGVHNSVNDCGSWPEVCHLYIDEMCLDPRFEEPGSEEEEQECSLWESDSNLDLESDLPKTRSISVTSQPWPVDFRLCIEIKDYDFLNSDDHIEDLLILESLNTSSEFTDQKEFRNSNGRITLTVRFRVQCSGGYEGPHCDCRPRNDNASGHYSCRQDGGISCLPGYTNTSNLCRQLDYCRDVVCPSNGKCINSPTSYTCAAPSPSPTPSPTPSPPPSPTPTPVSREHCNCATGMSCMEEGGVYRCVCPEGFAGENCSSRDDSATAAPRLESGEESATPTAVVAAIVAGLLVALLLCGVLVAVTVVCIRLRRKRWSTFVAKGNGRGGCAPMRLPSSSVTSSQSNVVTNPTYGDAGLARNTTLTAVENGSSHNGDTLRNLPNPFYDYGRVNSNDVDNPLYKEHPPQPAGEEDIYSVPHGSPTASTASRESGGEGGGIYSDLKSPPVGAGAVYSYATVGTAGGDGSTTTDGGGITIQGNEYAIPTGPPRWAEAPYDTLNHGPHQQQQQQQQLAPQPQLRLAELSAAYNTLNHSRQ